MNSTSVSPHQKTAVVLYSGGKGSFMAAYLAKKMYGATLLYFNDTKTEDYDLYRFIRETAEWLDLPLVSDSYGKDVWEVFEEKKFVGNSRVDVCSRVLKRDRSHKWIRKNYPNSDKTDVIVGLGMFEQHRVEKATPHWKPYNLVAPLFDSMVDEKELFQQLLLESGIKQPRLYDLGFPHNNCGGFCVKAGLAQFKMLYEKLPEVYLYHEQKQEELMVKCPKVRPFLKKQIKGKTHYLTLKQYREQYLEDGQLKLSFDEEYDFGGCGCAL
jgi:3'-phosphoadenosine 5'-phosphosulfate sulfotransferase (PAPS reductase)/FAD synthetase